MTRAVNNGVGTAGTTGQFPIISEWLGITQEMIEQFGTITLDPDPMHMDVEWAREHSPFGGTVAYGFLTVSLLSHLFNNARKGYAEAPYVTPGLAYVNYGFDKLRLVRPVRAGIRIRGHFSLLSGTGRTREGHKILKLACHVEIEGLPEPALVGEWLIVGVSSGPHPNGDKPS